MTVALIDLSPELSYTSVPRLSPHSFLQAKAKNTSHYAMLAGPSNIFLDNNFIAKVYVLYMYMQQYMVHWERYEKFSLSSRWGQKGVDISKLNNIIILLAILPD